MGIDETVTDTDDEIFQSSTQRDFVVTATRTPQREEFTSAAGDSVDKEWVTEHARQVGKEGPASIPTHSRVVLSVVSVYVCFNEYCAITQRGMAFNLFIPGAHPVN